MQLLLQSDGQTALATADIAAGWRRLTNTFGFCEECRCSVHLQGQIQVCIIRPNGGRHRQAQLVRLGLTTSLLLLLRPLVGIRVKDEIAKSHCSVDDQCRVMLRRLVLPDVSITHLVAETR